MKKYSIKCTKCDLKLVLKDPGVSLEIFCEHCSSVIFTDKTDFTITHFPNHIKVCEVNKTQSSQKKHPVIDGYQILSRIGQGAMGDVFLAENIDDQQKVVFKFLRDKKNKDHFIREAQVMSSLSHPYIVDFIGCGNFNNKCYFIMEYIEGIDLEKQLHENSLTLLDSLKIIYHAASALEYGIEKNIIHRDLKPANIMLPSKIPTKPKIVDFGLAKFTQDPYSELTNTGDVKGTLHYMSPEQAKHSKKVDHRTDIYSLGATLYHMLSGQRPFSEFRANNIHSMLVFIAQGSRPASLSLLSPECPQEIISIVEKAMHPNSSDRFQTPTELRAAIKNFIRSQK